MKKLLTVVGIGTTASASDYDGKFVKYNHTLGKFEFDSGIETRLNLTSEKSIIGSGNTINILYDVDGGNIGIITSPDGPISINVTGIPTDSSFDNRVLKFSVFVNQGLVGYACTTVTLNGVLSTIKYIDNNVSTGSTSSYDIFNFTCINPIGFASTASNYIVLGTLSANFK